MTMKVTITDREALSALSGEALQSYLLASSKWQHADDIPGKAAVYQHTDETGRLWEILVPLRRDLADYVSRMADAVTILARIEDRSELDIYDDLRRQGSQQPDVDDATRAVHEKIRRWLAEEGWHVRDVDDPQASFNVVATLRGGPNVNIFQYKQHRDHITLSQHWLFDQEFRSDVAQLAEGVQREIIWNIYRDVTIMGVEFNDLDTPADQMTFRTYIYFDGLTKDVLIQRILLTIRAVSLAIRSFIRALDEHGRSSEAAVRQLQLVPRPDGSLMAAS